MKKLFSFAIVICFFLTGLVTQAQTCLVIRDSIIAGERTSTFSDYIYGPNNRIDLVTHTDSGSFIVTTSDLVLYTGSDITEIRTFNTIGASTIIKTITYTRTSGKISRVDATGDNGSAWSISHDIAYDGNGNIQQIVVDTTSITGSPEVFDASFLDIVWANGNISTLSILLGSDTIELTATTDNKNNIFKKILNTEAATYLFQAASLNNLVTVELVNDESAIGQTAGTKIVDRIFTYNTDNDVEIMEEKSTPLNQSAKTTQYIYDCNVGIRTPQAATAISLYPNPAQNVISIENGNFKGVVKIFDITGKQLFGNTIDGETTMLDISILGSGMYSLEMVDGGKIFRGKFLVNQ
ncbi:MAG: T9SS type A sorting domain-containing protein [Chitinophagales bacterium]|nr:T9SS type A sorting domain-containing protein [Chitinophagales bacterium]